MNVKDVAETCFGKILHLQEAPYAKLQPVVNDKLLFARFNSP